MSKKQWLVILIIAILAGVLLVNMVQDKSSSTSLPKNKKEKSKNPPPQKHPKTIDLEKPPFIGD